MVMKSRVGCVLLNAPKRLPEWCVKGHDAPYKSRSQYNRRLDQGAGRPSDPGFTAENRSAERDLARLQYVDMFWVVLGV